MAITIYTKDGVALDAIRERAFLLPMFGSTNQILDDMTVKANGSGFVVDRTAGTYQIQGVVIEDDAAQASWKDLDVVEPDDSGVRTYAAYVKFNPLTDALPTYDLISFNDALLPTVFTDPSYLVMAVIVLPFGATNATQASFRRPDLLWRKSEWLAAAVDALALDFRIVTFEQNAGGAEGSGSWRLRWRNMSVRGERLDVEYAVQGGTINISSPLPGENLIDELVVPNWKSGFFFIRAPIDSEGAHATPQSAELEFVGIKSGNGEIQADDTWWGGDDSFMLGERGYPYRPQRHDIKILGTLSDEVICWANGAVTVLGGSSIPKLGNTHQVIELVSSAYGTSATPDLFDGKIDIDDLITNADKLAQFGLDAAYDGNTTPGSGRIIEADSGAVVVQVFQDTQAEPWKAGVQVEQNVGEDLFFPNFEVGFEVIDRVATPDEYRLALRQRRVCTISGNVLQDEACTLTYNAGDQVVELALTAPGAPSTPEFLQEINTNRKRLLATFTEVPGPNNNAEIWVFELVPVQVLGYTCIKLAGLSATEDIPAYDNTLFGAMLSPVNCKITIWESTVEIGGETSRLVSNLELAGDLDVEGDLDVGGVVTVGTLSPSSIAGSPPATLGATTSSSLDVANTLTAGDVAGVKTLSASDTALTVERAATFNAAVQINAALAASSMQSSGLITAQVKTSYRYGSTQTLTRAVALLPTERGSGWSVAASSDYYEASGSGTDYLYFHFVIPPGATLTDIKTRARRTDPTNVFSLSIVKLSRGTGGNFVDRSASSDASFTLSDTVTDRDLTGMSLLAAEGDSFLLVVAGRSARLGMVIQAVYTTVIHAAP